MRIHILGICGTFMGGIALIARQLGHTVSGCDQNVYPPMSDTLQAAGIEIIEGYELEQLKPKPDLVIVGNAYSRGNPLLEAVLNRHLPYISGPEWLANQVLHERHVVAVSGTHGKTTTSSMTMWILQHAGLNPGYLIGGVPQGNLQSAALGEGSCFVIEADEYDTAFWDKRSKFMHYRPRTLILNNLEYDHADIFPDMEAIKKQFQYLLRTVPAAGLVIYPTVGADIADVLSRGCWANLQTVGTGGVWQAQNINPDGSQFELWHRDQNLGVVNWSQCGMHNIHNGLAAAAAAHDVGVTADKLLSGLASFPGVKRRLEVRGQVRGVTVYDDFAHHPTAVATTLAGLRARVGQQHIIAVLQFGSSTMRDGLHRDVMAEALQEADAVFMLRPDSQLWDAGQIVEQLEAPAVVLDQVDEIVTRIIDTVSSSDHILVMSNKGFGGIHDRLLSALNV